MTRKNNENILNVKKWNYCNYSSDNYGAHSIAIQLGSRTVYYSYGSIVAFMGENSKGNKFYCIHTNDWGPTTGKHLNAIDPDKEKRINEEEFNKKLADFLL